MVGYGSMLRLTLQADARIRSRARRDSIKAARPCDGTHVTGRRKAGVGQVRQKVEA
jgi:hypothetical protein